MNGPTVGSGPTEGPYKKTTEAAHEFRDVVKGVPVGDLAEAAGVSKDTASNWKKGKKFPSGPTLLDLAAIPTVYRFIRSKIDPLASPEQSQAAMVADMIQNMQGPQGDALRAFFKQ